MEKNTKILGIGASGLIGSCVTQLLADSYHVDNLSTETGFDIRKSEIVDQQIGDDTLHSTVILFAAKTDVDGCEKDKETDQSIRQKNISQQQSYFRENATAWSINVFGVQNVVNACKKAKKKLIYISTDFVFDGKNPPEGGYREKDQVSPADWYGQTKYEGEKIILQAELDSLIIRPAFPYRSDVFAGKKDFVHVIMDRMHKNMQVQAITDALITPTFVDDFAFALKALLDYNAQGIYHVVGSQSLTSYMVAMMLAEKFHYDTSLVSKTTAETFYKGRAPRPFKSVINNDKIEALGVKMRTFEEGLEQVKSL